MSVQVEKYFIGIDVSKNKLDVHKHPAGENLTVSNDKSGYEELAAWLGNTHQIMLITMESTGGHELAAWQHLQKVGYAVHVGHLSRISYYAKSRNLFVKTDKIDAKMLAMYGSDMNPEISKMHDNGTSELLSLCVRRSQLIEIISDERRRSKAPKQAKSKSIQRHIIWLEKEIINITQDIAAKIATLGESAKQKLELLQEIKGVGAITAAYLLAMMPELGTISNRTASALAGLAPYNNDSGNFRGKRFIKGGRKRARDAIYMASMAASRHNPEIKAFFQKLKLAGKPPKLALIAAARKLLTIINAKMKKLYNQQNYDKKLQTLA